MKKIILLCAFNLVVRLSYSQDLSPTDRRLSVAVIGFDLNEPEAKALLAQRANINAVNGAMGGETFLITAIKGFKEPKVIKFLLDNGADPNIKDERGRTALSYAQQYNFSRKKDGRDIIQMLMTAMKIQPEEKEQTGKNTVAAPVIKEGKQHSVQVRTNQALHKTGPPGVSEVKATMEESLTGIYQNHFFGVKNTVDFEWSGPVTVGGLQTVASAPEACYPVRLKVKVTITDPRDGNTSVQSRGQEAKIGGYLKNEIFCFYRDGFGRWSYGIYER